MRPALAEFEGVYAVIWLINYIKSYRLFPTIEISLAGRYSILQPRLVILT